MEMHFHKFFLRLNELLESSVSHDVSRYTLFRICIVADFVLRNFSTKLYSFIQKITTIKTKKITDITLLLR